MANSESTKWVRLGDYIEQSNERAGNRFSINDVVGISTDKKFIETKANMTDVSLDSYKVVKTSQFAYVADTSRRGDKIALALNTSEKSMLISSIYTVFYVIDEATVVPEFLFLMLNRKEFDRYARFNSWGSARETFDWSEMCRIKIPLPSIEVQRELVTAYNGLKELAEQNEALLPKLSAACHAYIVDCRDKYPSVPLGNYIDIYHVKNADCAITLEQGININKEFITPQRANSDLSSRIIVRTGQFAYCTQLNNENVAIAYREGADCVVSPVYNTFEIKPEYKKALLPKYLFLWLQRKEFGRYVYWKSIGSAYEFLQEENLCEYEIPIPPIEVQQAIVDVYHCLERAKKIATEARAHLKQICPALIQRAANS